MEQQELFDDLPKPQVSDVADPPHLAFMFGYKGGDVSITSQEARALFAALGNFLQLVETVKHGRK